MRKVPPGAWHDALAVLFASVSTVSIGLFITTDVSALVVSWLLTMLSF